MHPLTLRVGCVKCLKHNAKLFFCLRMQRIFSQQPGADGSQPSQVSVGGGQTSYGSQVRHTFALFGPLGYCSSQGPFRSGPVRSARDHGMRAQ